jgi:transposase
MARPARPAATPEQERLRAALAVQGRSQAWLAAEIGVSQMTVSRWLGRTAVDRGEKVPKPMRRAVARALKIPQRELFNDRED